MTLREYLNPLHGWRDSSDVEKVRVYTQQSFLLIVAACGIAAIATSLAGGDVGTAAVAAVCAVAAVVVLQRTPSLGGTSTGDIRPAVVVLLISAALLFVLGGTSLSVWAAVLSSAALAALVDLRWSTAAAGVVLVVVAISGGGLAAAVAVGFVVVMMAVTVRLSMWLLRIVTELDATRDAAAALSVAEERLRFSRDLHDVVGRALSAIAVKSELAATLARRGDDRAADQMDEVRDLAQDSMTDARELVRGYRTVDAASELVGARSLLSAAGIRTDLVGTVADIPEGAAEQAAWVLREGVTNILRHSHASFCRIEFDVDTIRIVNDGPNPVSASGDGTGLNGLRERLTAVGGNLTVDAASDTFTLTAEFAPTRGTS